MDTKTKEKEVSLEEEIQNDIKEGNTFLIDEDVFGFQPYPCPQLYDCEHYAPESWDDLNGCQAGQDCPYDGKYIMRFAGKHSEKHPHHAVLVELIVTKELRDAYVNFVQELEK